jgi:hypothetical protein
VKTAADVVARLAARKEPALLVPKGSWDAGIDAAVERLPRGPLQSALFLWNDNLTRAHEVAQEISTPLGSVLHGTMHRREPDYGNSKYWFQKVGEHPLRDGLRRAARELGTPGEWDPFRMVDWCEQAAPMKPDAPLVLVLRELQRRELELLARLCL